MAGIRFQKVPGSGFFERRLTFKEGNSATQNFGIKETNEWQLSGIPKPKFLFFVQFNSPFYRDDTPAGLIDPSKLKNPKDGVVFQLKSIDRPKIQPAVETLNQYNKKRVIQTKIDYQAATMRFHDDVNDKVLAFWADYFAFYYGDGKKAGFDEWQYDQTNAEFQEHGGWGYRGQFKDGSPQNQHYLSSIDILQFYGGQSIKMSFINPIITMMDHDENDYAEGTTGSGITMQIDYEGIVYDLSKTPLDEKDAEKYGFATDWYNPEPDGFLDKLLSTGGSAFLSGNFKSNLFRSGGFIGNQLGGLATRVGLPPTGATVITNSLLRTARQNIENGTPVSQGLRSSFGSNAFGTLGQTVGNSSQVLQSKGILPAIRADTSVPQKKAGVVSTMDNFGRYDPTLPGAQIEGVPEALNSGNSPTNLSNASSEMSSITQTVNNGLAESGPITTTGAVSGDFSSTFGAAANLATQQGLVKNVSQPSDQITEDTQANDAVITKLPDGKIALTERGSAVMNSLRTPTSAVGTKAPISPWKNPKTIGNNNRALNIEKGHKAPRRF